MLAFNVGPTTSETTSYETSMQVNRCFCVQHYKLDDETLLSTALQLSCNARNLSNELKMLVSLSVSAREQSSEYNVQRRHYVSVLSGVSHTVDSVKTVVAMIDRLCITDV